MNKFEIIQGDSVTATLEIEGQNAIDVVGIQFVCDSLKVTYDLETTADPLIWMIDIPSEDTKNMRIGVFKYNLVATYVGGWKKTIVYGQDVEILLRDNEWTKAN